MVKLQMPRGYPLLNEYKIGTWCINRSVPGLWTDGQTQEVCLWSRRFFRAVRDCEYHIAFWWVINLSVCIWLYAYVICNEANLVLRKEKREIKWKKCKSEKKGQEEGRKWWIGIINNIQERMKKILKILFNNILINITYGQGYRLQFYKYSGVCYNERMLQRTVFVN